MENRLTPGLFIFKKDHHRFDIVSVYEFEEMIKCLTEPPRIATDLKEQCDLINYYLDLKSMPLFRLMGCNTPQVAYISQGIYFVHEALIRLHNSKKILQRKGAKFPL